MNKEEILNAFLLANIPEIITQEEFNDVKKAIKQLQQENQELKERHYLIQGGRGNCKTLVLMLQKENDKYKSVLDEIREYIEKHKMIDYDEFEYISTSPDTMLQILDKANEQKW